MSRAAIITASLLSLVATGDAAGAADPAQFEPYCQFGKGIERALGIDGYRVVAGGGYRIADNRPVKVQIWQKENRDWVITEAFFRQNKTCVVRAGQRLHMLY